MDKINLILLPGFLSTASLWEHQITHLKDIANIKVIPLLKENTAEKMIAAVLSHAEGKFALAGHSIGGWIALEVARKYPDRVIKLCVLNTMAEPDTAEILANRKKRINEAKTGNFEKYAKELTDYFVVNQAAKKAILSMFLTTNSQDLINQQNAMIHRHASLVSLKEIQCPSLIIAARKDPYFTLEMHQAMVDQIPNAKLAIVENSGHMSPMEAPQAITKLMRHWLENYSSC
jgi:pimeloyl-ACP methyl ester carboxylesterase